MAILTYKWVVWCLVSALHPFFVSVTEIQLNPKTKQMEIGCKIFTDDLERTLEAAYHQKVDLTHPVDRAATGRLINDYIARHLLVRADGVLVHPQFVGFEQEEDATWSYFQVPGLFEARKVAIHNDLLFEYKKEQINIVYVTVHGSRQGSKLDNPDADLSFTF
jgi:hypothetical protein